MKRYSVYCSTKQAYYGGVSENFDIIWTENPLIYFDELCSLHIKALLNKNIIVYTNLND